MQPSDSGRPLTTLRRFSKPRQRPAEYCGLCSLGLAEDHQHLIDPRSRKLICSCDGCAMLFPNQPDRQYRRIPRDCRLLTSFQIDDANWDALLIPINMAFFFRSSVDNRIVALYPSPAGPMQSLLELDAWNDIEMENPILRSMESDVEALLVNRLGSRFGQDSHDYFLAPIDRCYQLVGLLRVHWQGLSGGTDVWRQIQSFFEELREKSICLS